MPKAARKDFSNAESPYKNRRGQRGEQKALKDTLMAKKCSIPHRLAHVIMHGGRFHDDNGHVEDVNGYITACKQVIMGYKGKSRNGKEVDVPGWGKISKCVEPVVHINGCSDIFHYHRRYKEPALHFHAIVGIMMKPDKETDMFDKFNRQRAFFRLMGNQEFGCKECDQKRISGSAQKCQTCDTGFRIKQINDEDHLENVKRYINKRRAEYEGREVNELGETITKCEGNHENEKEKQRCYDCQNARMRGAFDDLDKEAEVENEKEEDEEDESGDESGSSEEESGDDSGEDDD